MQYSEVTFLTYSLSVSLLRRFRNSWRAKGSEEDQADLPGRGGRLYLDCVYLFLGPIPLVHKTDDASSTPSNRDLATNTVFLGEITLARREAGCSVRLRFFGLLRTGTTLA